MRPLYKTNQIRCYLLDIISIRKLIHIVLACLIRLTLLLSQSIVEQFEAIRAATDTIILLINLYLLF